MPEWHDSWWSPETRELRRKFAAHWREEFDKTMNHFSGLRDSMKEHGMISPVSLIGGPPRDKFLHNPIEVAGHIPPEYQAEPDLLLMTQPFGGSRVTIAQELRMDAIPCVIHDFTNLFPNAPLVTKTNYQDWFGRQYMFASTPPYIRDGAMNDTHRKAQQNAHKVAREAMNV